MTETLVHDPAVHKLGKKLGVVHDRRTLKLSSFVTPRALPTPPKTFDAGKNVTDWPIFANDRYGDCTCAGFAHLIQAMMAATGRQGFDLTDDDVLKVYAAVTGFDPTTGANDNGAYLLDVLNYVRKNGIGAARTDTADNLHRPSGFVSVDVKPAKLRLAAWLFGGLYVGAGLPIRAQRQNVWDVVGDGKTGDDAFGSWGGHCFYIPAYRPTNFDGIPWGDGAARKTITDAWITAYVDEVYAIVDHDWINRRGWKSPSGFRFDALVAAIAQFGSASAEAVV